MKDGILPGTFIGVDGCRAGWAAVSIDSGGALKFELIGAADERRLCEVLSGAAVAYVDMPAGLAGPGFDERRCDTAARTLLRALGGSGSSVFPVPDRAAFDADSYEEACRVQRARTGKAITLQAWNLRSRILAFDRVFRAVPAAAERVFESHPEICFRAFQTDDRPLARKRTVAGREERIAVLENHLPTVRRVTEAALVHTRRSDVQHDDILDATVLCVAARRAARSDAVVSRRTAFGHYLLPLEGAQTDASGVPARIAVPDTERVRTLLQGSLLGQS